VEERTMVNNLHFFILSELNKYGGGIETWLNYFLQNFYFTKINGKIFIYHVKTKKDQESIPEIIKNSKIEYIPVRVSRLKNRGFRNIVKFTIVNLFRSIIKIKKNDIVVSIGTIYTAPISILIKKIFKKNIKLITWVRSISVEEMKISGSRSKFYNVSKKLEEYLIKASDFILTNGKDTENYYSKKYKINGSKIQVINNAVDSSKFKNIPIPEFKKRRISVAYTGRLSTAKGFLDFLSAIDQLDKEDYKNLEMNIYGHGENEKLINKKILNYYGKYYPEDIFNILSNNDVIFFLNKDGKGGGVSHSLLEAMAAGRLIVAYNNPIHNQILNDDCAILIEESIDEIKKVLKKLNHGYYDPNELQKKCELARKEAANYSIENHLTTFYSVINKLTDN
jgi:glycosyltransferase involved in cell wall biosynthesis